MHGDLSTLAAALMLLGGMPGCSLVVCAISHGRVTLMLATRLDSAVGVGSSTGAGSCTRQVLSLRLAIIAV